MHQEEFIAVALGEKKADLVIKNAQIVNVLTEEIYESDVAITNGRVAGVAKGYQGEKDLRLRPPHKDPGAVPVPRHASLSFGCALRRLSASGHGLCPPASL